MPVFLPFKSPLRCFCKVSLLSHGSAAMGVKAKLCSLRSGSCRHGSSLTGGTSYVPSKLNVNEAYRETLRTKSYTDIWSKLHAEIGSARSSFSSPSSSAAARRVSDGLLEPRQEALMALIRGPQLHSLIFDYFEGSLEAFHICTSLHEKINQARANYRIIQKVLRHARWVDGEDYSDELCRLVSGGLAAFAKLENPLSGSSQVQFRRVHDLYGSLPRQLTEARRKILRQAKIARVCKRVARGGLILLCSCFAVVFVAAMAHTVVGLAAAPALLWAAAAFPRRLPGEQSLRREAAQLDAAARGAYILDRDLETMSRLVRRLHDEIEHSKAMIMIYLRSPRKCLLKEVVKEFESSECSFLEQLEELEEHVYLCFLTINRARRLVLQELALEEEALLRS